MYMKRLKILNRICYLIIKKDHEKVVLMDYFLLYGRRVKLRKIDLEEIPKEIELNNEVVYIKT